jgi:DivIVA domain-containing protein
MALEPATRLTSRDILSKTFSAKTRRGYSPIEVDRFLRRVADGVDELNRELDRLMFGGPGASLAAAEAQQAPLSQLPPPPSPEMLAAYQSGQELRLPEPAVSEAPAPAPIPEAVAEPDHLTEAGAAFIEETGPTEAAVAAKAAAVAEQLSVAEEAVELLRMAKDTADRTMAEARLRGEGLVVQARHDAETITGAAQVRADEIVADATLRASEITREADRKAFEAASRRRAEVAEIERQIEAKRIELDELHRATTVTRDQLRGLGRQALDIAGEELPDVVVDLTERRPESMRSQHPAFDTD